MFSMSKAAYPNKLLKEVHCSEPFPSARVPWKDQYLEYVGMPTFSKDYLIVRESE
jgi:hypothetical protein